MRPPYGPCIRRRRTAIELGGQDAKVIFFHYDAAKEQLVTSDMRMNGSCAGGTGAFIDEIATLLQTPTEAFEALAAAGKTIHNISGRCGVFARTDIQSILNQGGSREVSRCRFFMPLPGRPSAGWHRDWN